MATAEDNYRVEVWSADETALIETISRSSEFSVSMAAWHEAVRCRPGMLLIHKNAGHVMDKLVSPGEPYDGKEGYVATLGTLRDWHRLRVSGVSEQPASLD